MAPLPTSAVAASSPGRAGERGFTLVETLVALLLMALVGLTLVRFQAFQLAGTGQLATAALVRMEVDNRAIDLAVQQRAIDAPVSGMSTNAGIPLYWRAAPAAPPAGDLFAELVRIEVAVALAPDAPPVATRTILRPREHPRSTA